MATVLLVFFWVSFPTSEVCQTEKLPKLPITYFFPRNSNTFFSITTLSISSVMILIWFFELLFFVVLLYARNLTHQKANLDAGQSFPLMFKHALLYHADCDFSDNTPLYTFSFIYEKFGFCTLKQKTDRPELRKNAYLSDLSWQSNSFFSTIPGGQFPRRLQSKLSYLKIWISSVDVSFDTLCFFKKLPRKK